MIHGSGAGPDPLYPGDMALPVPTQIATTLGIPPRVVDVLTFPVRAAVAFGQASIGVAQLCGALNRLLAEEGAIDRLLAPGGVIDRLLDREGLIEQLVAEDGIIDRLGDLMVNVDRLGPVPEFPLPPGARRRRPASTPAPEPDRAADVMIPGITVG